MDNNIIFAAGLGSTGSSALVDLLREVKGFYSMDDEFRLFVDPYGLISLRDALVDNWSIFQADTAITNFKKLAFDLNYRHRSRYVGLAHSKYFGGFFLEETERFINEISEFEYRGIWYGNASRIERKLNTFSYLRKSRIGSKKMYVGKNLDAAEFSSAARKYIENLVSFLLKKHNKTLFCFNENLSCMFPEKINNLLPNSKVILVIRDPKDVYADSVRVKWGAIPDDPAQFIKWQIAVYKGWMKVQERLQDFKKVSESILVVKFEDFISNYSKVIGEIFDFLDIQPEEHIAKKKYFNPDKSNKNVGQWKTLLNENDVEKFHKELAFFYKYYDYKL